MSATITTLVPATTTTSNLSTSSTSSTTAAPAARSAARRRLRSIGFTLAVGVVGAAVTTAAAAVVHAAGVPFAIDGEMIPLAGFAQMTLLGAIIGGLLLAVTNRFSARPRHRFVQITSALTVLSCLPSVALPPDAATKVALVALHVLAAVIIVPPLARRAGH
jgi:hypothetical protein